MAEGGRFIALDAAKLRGGYYTPHELAAWLCGWAVRAAADSVLEPSCGDGVFLAAAGERLAGLGAAAAAIAGQLAGVEIVPGEAAAARARLRGRLGAGCAEVVAVGDFFQWWLRPARRSFDAVVGNPPFIRYQSFPEPHRSRAMGILAQLGLTPNRLTNIWVPFVAAAAASLRAGGRLALVLPAELLQVSYASQLRSFLTGHFARLDIVACNDLPFANAEQEVVLLLADGAAVPGGAAVEPCRVALTETRCVAEVTARPAAAALAGAVPKTVRHDAEKWLKYFLTVREIDLMRELRGAAAVTTLATHAGVDVGVVTGRNEFFVLRRCQVEELALEACTLPLVSRSAQLKGAALTTPEWQALADAGDRVQLLHLKPLNGTPLAPALAAYIRRGEAAGIHQGYKCSIRAPWYAVPAVWVPAGFAFRQIYDFPRFVLNQAGATSTDTIHRLTCKADPAAVVANAYTHLTAASAEIEGRSYGGGVLELEPTEAERLLMPARLEAALPLAECDRLVRAGRLGEVLAANDRLVLAGQLGLARGDCAMLRDIWVKMRDRRHARRRGGRRPRRATASTALAAIAAATALGALLSAFAPPVPPPPTPAIPAMVASPASPASPAIPEITASLEIVALGPAAAVERELSPAATHLYAAELAAGRSYRVVAAQHGIDVVLEVAAPGDESLAAVDSPLDREGEESLLVEPQAAGRYRIAVRSRELGAPPGRYSVRFDELPRATAADQGRLAAERALTRAGRLYLEGSPEARRQAIVEYRAAAALLHILPDRREETRALYCAAVLLRLVDQAHEALALAREVLPLWRQLDDRRWEANTANEIGLDLWLAGEAPEARRSFESARELAHAAGDAYSEAVAQANLCLADLARGDLAAGRACYERSLPLLRRVQAAPLEAAALTNLGRVYDVLGEPQDALATYRLALARLRAAGDLLGQARTLNNLGLLATEMGESQQALADFGAALELFRGLEDRRGQARVLHNVGVVYHALGELQPALASYRQALPLWREVGDRTGEASTLMNLGLVDGRLGRLREALAFHQEALAVRRAAGDRRGEGVALSQLGRTYLAAGEPQRALAAFGEGAERLRAAGDVPDEAAALCGQGEARIATGEPAQALAALARALELARAAGYRPVEAAALAALARAEHAAGHAELAGFHAAAALEVIESLRTRIGSPDLRSAFSDVEHQAYQLDVELLMEAHRRAPGSGFDRQALAVAERARARTLVELLEEAQVELREGVDDTLRERRRALAARLSAKAERAMLARREGGQEQPALAQEQQEILRQLDFLEAEIRERNPAYAALTRPQPLAAADMAGLLDPETLLLSYTLGEARSFLWVVSTTGTASFELPPRAELEALARRLHLLWSAVDPAARGAAAQAAAELGRLLLGPVADRLQSRRLAVVADGALHYVPFGALPLPAAGSEGPPGAALPAAGPVLLRHEVVYLPSASALAVARRVLARRPAALKWLAVLADPVFDARDPRVSDPLPATLPAAAPPAFARLPESRQEAEAIAALAPPGQALVALDFAASRAQVLGDRLSAYRIVHFATHGVLDTEHPSLSGLQLSSVDPAGRPQDGFVHLRDIYNLRLGAELVVLSGCRTALGRELLGEGLVGLTRGFQYAGAARVVASLWPVEDRATAALMARFYRAMWVEGLAPAAALRAAQLAIRQQPRWRQPYFWAGFVLAGDWR